MTVRESSNYLLLPLALGTFVLGTDLFVMNGLLPIIASDLHVSVAQAGQLTTIFAATYAVSSPIIAASTGSLDRRWVLAAGAALFTLGMIGQAAGTTYLVVALGRFAAAIGAAAFQSTAFMVAAALTSEENRGRALALVTTGMTVSSVAGVPIGILAERWIGWRGVMWAIAAVAAVVMVAVTLLPRVTLPAAGLRDRLAVLVQPRVLHVLAVSVLAMVALFGAFGYLPTILESGVPHTALPWVFVLFGTGQVLGNNRAGVWCDRLGAHRTMLIGLIGVAVGLAALTVGAGHLVSALVLAALIGFFGGMVTVPQQHRLFKVAPQAPTVALGLNGSAIYAGVALGASLGGVVLHQAGPGWLAPTATVVALLAVAVAATIRQPVATAKDPVRV